MVSHRSTVELRSCSSCVSLSLGCLKCAKKADEKCKFTVHILHFCLRYFARFCCIFMISDHHLEWCSVGLFRFLHKSSWKCGLSVSCPLLRTVNWAWDYIQSISKQRVIIAVFTAGSRLKFAHAACQVAICVGSFVSTSLQGCGGSKEENLSVSDDTTTESGNTTVTVTVTTTATTTSVASRWSPSNDGCLRVPLWSAIYHTHTRGKGWSETWMNKT